MNYSRTSNNDPQAFPTVASSGQPTAVLGNAQTLARKAIFLLPRGCGPWKIGISRLCPHHAGLVSQSDQEAPEALIGNCPREEEALTHSLPSVLEPPEHHGLSSEAWKITTWHVNASLACSQGNSYFFSSPGDQTYFVNIGP